MNFFNSLRFKLVVFSILIEIAVLTLLISNADRLILSHLSAQAYKQIQSIKSNFQASILPLLVERDYGSLDSLLTEYTQAKDIVYIFIVKEGRIIANSNWKGKNKFPRQDKKLDKFKNIFNTNVDITYSNKSYGKVYFGVDTSFLKQAQNELFSQSFLIALIEIILSVILLFSIGYLLTKHLITLTQAAEKITQNQFDINLNIKSKDELGLLAKTFNQMSKQIKTQFATIQQQNELEKTIFDNMAHILIATDKNGIITAFNKQAEKILGYTADEVIGKYSPEIFYDKQELIEVAKQYSKKFNENFEPNFKLLVYKTDKGLINQAHWKHITKDNKELIVKLTITALKDQSGKIYGYIGVAEDKTEKYYLEKSLEEETHRVKTILENAGDFIHILDNNGNLFMYSDSFLESLGYTEDEANNLNVVNWDENFNPNTMIQNLLDHPRTFETIHTRKDGTKFDVEVRTNGIILEGKTYLYAASRDISERKQAQHELQQKDMLLQQQTRLASMGEMIGNIAHQWRQPLSLIATMATSYHLKKNFNQPIVPDELYNDMAKINDVAQHLSQTIDDFRDFFKNNDTKQVFSVLKVIDDCENITSAAYKNHYITLKKEINEEQLEYNGSSSMLAQVILNLLSNAKDILIEKNIENKVVKINIYRHLGNIIITVKDNGGGVPENIMDKIFDPYFTTKHQSQGTGIGLYMSSQIIQKHFEGQLNIKNIDDEDGYGAEFKIVI